MSTATMPVELSTPLIQRGTRVSSKLATFVIALLVAILLLLQNPYWVRHGDSEVFLSLARNIATGHGYQFNGEPVARVPPGWPMVLAGAMKISPDLWFLKLLPMVALLAFLLVSYRLLLSWTTPLIAALCVITAATLEPVFSLSYLFFSDGLFAFIAVTAVALALKISNGADAWWRIALLAILCAASVVVRSAGLAWFVVVATALLHGELWPRVNRRWIALLICGSATAIAFIALRIALKADPAKLDPRYDQFLAGAYDIVNQVDRMERIRQFGQWIGGLLWQEAQTYKIPRRTDNAAGWLVSLLILFFVIVPTLRRRQWVWAGGAIYLLGLGANWPDAIPRYIVPLAPFILAAIYVAVVRLADLLPHSRSWLRPLGLNLFFASVLGLNGAMLFLQIAVMRSHNFYDHYQGGVQKELINAGLFLYEQPKHDYEIAISQRIEDFGHVSYSDGYRRALNFLTNRSIINVPPELCREPNAELIAWLKAHNARYYLYEPPFWVIEHFALKTRDGKVLDPDDTAWHLYEIKDDKAVRVTPGITSNWPAAVPGM